MNYLSVCSGIEAATVAWHPLGWRPFAFAEVEKFPSQVLSHWYPDVPNLGDVRKFRRWPDAAIDVLVGGTPCQSFSIAGLRQGMADPRGNLALVYLAIAERYRPKWVIWENVPGILSSGEGRDFGSFLGGLGQLGYGFAYRVLDAQYVRVDGFARAVPQRRRRVFVVGHLGDWRRAAAVLFERESLLWNSAPRRQPGQRVAPTISSRPTGGGGLGTDFDCDGGLIASTGDIAHCFNAGAMGVAFDMRGREGGSQFEGPHETANIRAASGGSSKSYVAQKWAVRRLAPRECERLQGFPDGYTAIAKAADGPRYKAVGNSMAVNIMRWLGMRIQMVEDLEVELRRQ
jgi:DNA (cytosine-5)-methyltransferase 1